MVRSYTHRYARKKKEKKTKKSVESLMFHRLLGCAIKFSKSKNQKPITFFPPRNRVLSVTDQGLWSPLIVAPPLSTTLLHWKGSFKCTVYITRILVAIVVVVFAIHIQKRRLYILNTQIYTLI